MNPLWGHAIGVMITLIMFTFIGIWIWAWRARHKNVFEHMANMPMQDSPYPDATRQTPTQHNEERT